MDTRTRFHTDMTRLSRETATLGALVADAIETSVVQLSAGDRNGSKRLIERDLDVNRRRYDIERDALTLIATQQPVARDMRQVAALIDIAGELERIGDYAKGIGQIHLNLPEAISPQVQEILDAMAQKSADMLRRSLAACEQLDAETARALQAEDDEVDELFNRLFSHVMGWQDRNGGLEQANYVLWIGHNLERTADRVTNICERVIFTATGELAIADED